VPAALAETTIAYLRKREQATLVYRELRLPARLADGRQIIALSYGVDRSHRQYAGRLDREELKRFVLQGRGESGENPDYVRNTQAHLAQLGIRDKTLEWLVKRLDEAHRRASAALSEDLDLLSSR